MNNKIFLSSVLILSCTVLFCKYTKAQNYDANFDKPITSQKGQFIYGELPPIKTEAGVLLGGSSP